MKNQSYDSSISEEQTVLKEILRYLSFWPYMMLSLLISIILTFTYLRYQNNLYQTTATIEIIDKAQDSEMSLPTAMTVFNRSMINLENEIGVLRSFSLHQNVVKKLNSNIKFFKVGNIKSSLTHKSDFFDDYQFTPLIDVESIDEKSSYKISFENDKLKIEKYDKSDEFVKEYIFDNMSSKTQNHDLPFELVINDISDLITREIQLLPFRGVVNSYINKINIKQTGVDSDQLEFKKNHENIKISEEYLNQLIFEFDKDGVVDRQLEYKRTMDFVDSRSEFLTKELNQIEKKRQDFKEQNDLTDVKTDANINISQRIEYDSELFKAESQKDLCEILIDLTTEDDGFELIPANIGLDDISLNNFISDYNLLVSNRARLLSSAGPTNSVLVNLENELRNAKKNIQNSLSGYLETINITINNLENKKGQFAEFYRNIPEIEKILRSIERELEVKEALFILLLQKREEAAINYAVVKPSIKIIDSALTNSIPISPNHSISYVIAIFLGLVFPVLILFILFTFDNKIHTREQLNLITSLPIIGEVPFILDSSRKEILATNSRLPLAESIRMISANLNYTLSEEKKESNVILVTSSVKGEGKTIISVNLASILSSKASSVLLIGTDLRNPQLHKFLNIDKNTGGLSDFIYKDNVKWSDFIIKNENLDVIISGTIPPNPTQILSSSKFKAFINEVKKHYDYIIIDSAPCLLVSDTFEISSLIDTTLYIVRSNYSELKLGEYINEVSNKNKLPKINLVLNGVGNSQAYGYKYGYQYGYKYGYKYGYNYGYGYGYSEDKE